MDSIPVQASQDADAADRRSLRRHKLFATGLLVGMAALCVGSFALPPGLGRDLLESAAKAGVVGGLADWFAVTALFRHPLGIPIPHTAIIPAQKARLGRALGRFIGAHVITQAEVSRVLVRADLPGILHRFLSDPATVKPAAEALAASLPRVLASLEDGRARRLLDRLLPRVIGGPAAGRVVARALYGLVEGGRHQEVFTFVLGQLRMMLTSKEDDLRGGIRDRVREQGGQILGWAIGASVAKRVISAVNAELDTVGPDGSTMRIAFDEWVRREIALIESDPERAAEIGRAIKQVIAHESVRNWIGDIWNRLRTAVERDAARPNGHTMALIEATLHKFGEAVEQDPAIRSGVERGAAAIVAGLLPLAQERAADFVADVVSQWDARTVTDRLELRVGRDLQYIRVNGTLVGFLAGGVLFLLLRAIFGSGAL
ncbi:MAG: DUF445 domain-containing protein [Proteobacteria bacterium]|nr:DUF445 domain-containing protein [Pseudomonadota bacterium]